MLFSFLFYVLSVSVCKSSAITSSHTVAVAAKEKTVVTRAGISYEALLLRETDIEMGSSPTIYEGVGAELSTTNNLGKGRFVHTSVVWTVHATDVSYLCVGDHN